MWIASEWEIGEIAECLRTPISRDDGRADVAAQDLRDFQVNQMWSVQRLVGGEDKTVHTLSGRRLQEDLKNR